MHLSIMMMMGWHLSLGIQIIKRIITKKSFIKPVVKRDMDATSRIFVYAVLFENINFTS